MNWVDWIILGVIAVSTALSVWRGFVKEALSLAAWVVAFVLATTFGGHLAALLRDVISHDALREISARALLFVATLMLATLVNSLLGSLIKMTGLSGLDRVLGTVFGFTRGAIIVMVLLFVLVNVLPADQQSALEQSTLKPHLLMVVEWAELHFSQLVGGGSIAWPK